MRTGEKRGKGVGTGHPPDSDASVHAPLYHSGTDIRRPTTCTFSFNVHGVMYVEDDGHTAPIEKEIRQLSSALEAVKDEQEYIVVRERLHRDSEFSVVQAWANTCAPADQRHTRPSRRYQPPRAQIPESSTGPSSKQSCSLLSVPGKSFT